ncbi:hypothetical protein ANCCAN_13488, partial [Ancylostoma caninum]
NVKAGRWSQKRSAPPLSLNDSAKIVKCSRKRSAPSSSRSDHAMIVDCSPKRSPPSLSRHLVELFDSILPTDICDGRMNFEEIMDRIRRFVGDLIVAASQSGARGVPSIDYNYQYSADPSRALLPTNQLGIENLLSPVRSPHILPYQPQNYSDSGRRPLSNVRMISEGREENYGLGAFQDANIRALLPNTPVYSAARLRNLVHSNGMAMTERENTEIVPVEKLDPHQFQLLQEEGFRLVTLDLPEDSTSLTNMQRMALADMRHGNENTPEKEPKSITY